MRDSSRLLVLHKDSGQVEHRIFKDLPDYLQPGDCMVFNDTRVLRARLLGVKKGGTAKVEVLLLAPRDNDYWVALVKPGKRLPVGSQVVFGNGRLQADIIEKLPDGSRIVKLSAGERETVAEAIEQVGLVPLPPYIKKKLRDAERYQTVYSREAGSAAAPTAGLHFTESLLETLKAKGVKQVFLTLHVGVGTFRPVKAENVEDHIMHEEYYRLEPEAAEVINRTKESGNRIIAVGTTVTRTLETTAGEDGFVRPGSGNTGIFIYPGYRFKIVDALLTNFHLPRSTLLMLVSALAGRERVMAAYQEAIGKKYRFFSFGDAMLII